MATNGSSAAADEIRPALAAIATNDRKDTPWQRMTDSEMTRAVEEVGGRVLIGLKDPASDAGVDNRGRVLAATDAVLSAKAELGALGIDVDYEFEDFPVVVARIASTDVARLRASPYVDYLEPSAAGTWASQVTPWNVTRVQAPSAWSFSTGSDVKLLIIDSGVVSSHPDLYPAVHWRCIGPGPVYDQIGHGTSVAGVAAAFNNSVHVVGVAHGVDLWSANVEVNGAPDTAEIACSLNIARINDVFVVNMSLGVPPSTAITDQVNAAYYAGWHGLGSLCGKHVRRGRYLSCHPPGSHRGHRHRHE
jgi:subtilisin family serine protease